MAGVAFASGGNRDQRVGKPASAFSKGAVLMFDSNSSLSAVNLTLAPDILGFALADSTESLGDEVPYEVIDPSNKYWFKTSTTVASTYTAGSAWDFIGDGANGHIIHSSATTARVVIAEGGAQGDIDQSDESRVIVRFIGNGGALQYL